MTDEQKAFLETWVASSGAAKMLIMPTNGDAGLILRVLAYMDEQGVEHFGCCPAANKPYADAFGFQA